MPMPTGCGSTRAHRLPSLVKQATHAEFVPLTVHRREVGHAHHRQHRAEDFFFVISSQA